MHIGKQVLGWVSWNYSWYYVLMSFVKHGHIIWCQQAFGEAHEEVAQEGQTQVICAELY